MSETGEYMLKRYVYRATHLGGLELRGTYVGYTLGERPR